MSLLSTLPNHVFKSVNQTPKRKLEQIKGLSEAKVEKIKEAAKKLSVSHWNELAPLISKFDLNSQLPVASSLLLSLPRFVSAASESLLAANSLMPV